MEWNTILELHNLPEVPADEYERLYESHAVSFQFFTLKKLDRGKGKKMYIFAPNTRIPGGWEPEKPPKSVIQIGVESWPANKFYLILERSTAINHLYKCDKFPGKCSYSSGKKEDVEKHKKSCVAETILESRQIIMGDKDTVRKEIIKAGQ